MKKTILMTAVIIATSAIMTACAPAPKSPNSCSTYYSVKKSSPYAFQEKYGGKKNVTVSGRVGSVKRTTGIFGDEAMVFTNGVQCSMRFTKATPEFKEKVRRGAYITAVCEDVDEGSIGVAFYGCRLAN